MYDGHRALIHLLDGQKLELLIKPRLLVAELLDIVASHVCLKHPDKKYFGIRYIDEDHQFRWLPDDRRVLDCEFSHKILLSRSPLLLYHNVRYFVDSVTSLQHPATVELFFLEAKNQLCEGLLDLSNSDFYNLVANYLQIYEGDFQTEECALLSLKTHLPFPKRLISNYGISYDTYEHNVIEAYKSLIGTSKGSSIMNFMQIAEKSSTYGSRFYNVQDRNGCPWTVALNSKGIYLYDADDISHPKKVFVWRLLDNLYYKDRKFSIEIRDNWRIIQSATDSSTSLADNNLIANDIDTSLSQFSNDKSHRLWNSQRAPAPSSVYFHAFFCDSAAQCKSLWTAAVAQHQFYLDQRTSHSAQNFITYTSTTAIATRCRCLNVTHVG
ncbi:hypothetical protein AB6A40_005963 [Gnathostoma spinigerum]|uniref:FERM domain-containing protein n=1 Tax=Gnathostoma spinigerum TaxID=75299 RepID=A0ABD6EM75_9BILA